MRQTRGLSILSLGLLWCSLLGHAQQAPTGSQSTSVVVPTLVNFNGVLTDVNRKPLTGTVGVTFCLYKDAAGGPPLWTETQNVRPDVTGHYSVVLGSTTSAGLPTSLFVSEEARWVGVQPQGQPEPPRVLLVSVPYALKAADADTVRGLPPSAFVLAASATSGTAGSPSSGSNSTLNPPTLGGSGKTNFLPIWTNGTTLGSSVLFQSGKGAKAHVGIGTTKPSSTLDVNGGSTIRGLFSLPATGTATSQAGFNSQAMDLAASVFNSTTNTPVLQTFQWQAEPVSNNTSNATGSLNLLFAQGAGKPAETGLNIASNGQITFASGQTFPGTGTITGVTAGAGLSGGGSSGNVTLNVPSSGITNSMLQNSSLTVNPGGGMTGGGNISLGGTTTLGLEACSANQILEFIAGAWTCANAATGTITGVTAGTDLTGGGTSGGVTLNLDTTKVPQLNASNIFNGNQSITGNLTTSGLVSGQTGSFTGNNTTQVFSVAQGGSGAAVSGQSSGAYGVLGVSSATGGFGVEGQGAYGVTGLSLSSTGAAGLFINANGGSVIAGEGSAGINFRVDGNGNITTSGSINTSGLIVQGAVTDPCLGATSSNLIGGYSNNVLTAGVTGATIGGGGGNQGKNLVTDDYGTVGGGAGNIAGNNSGTTCDVLFATVAGGADNGATGSFSTVGGGGGNFASGNSSTVSGGGGNIATGAAATVPGGNANVAGGDYSFAAGNGAVATDYGSFLWCSDNGNQCGSSGKNSFEVAVYGPILFYDGPNGAGCNLTAGGGSWNCSSDRNLKDNIVPIDSRSVLERVAHLPITQWKMKGEPAGLKHIGPMAQDFYAAFGLGDSDRYIALGDGQGVALAAVQALYQVVQTKDEQIGILKQQLQMIRETNTQIKKQLRELRHAQRREITAMEQRLARLETRGSMVRAKPNDSPAAQLHHENTAAYLFRSGDATPR
jgi:hypothetical protein